jgi:predicted lipoprotein with Yx(FWY)xxD motif
MVKNSLMLGMTVSALALLAGCGSSSSSSTQSTTSAAGATTAAGASATSTGSGGSAYGHTPATSTSSATGSGGVVVTSKHGKPGTVLAAGPKKMTVYLFEGDKGSTSSCSGACASAWPPVTTSAAATAAGAARSADLGAITRSDGSKQVTYKGHPLYFFVKDKDSGDAYGQGAKAFGADWYVLAPSGNKIDES